MLMVAAEYGRHDVLQYLLDSLNQIPEDGSQVLTEMQATKGRSQSGTSKDESYAEGPDSAGICKDALLYVSVCGHTSDFLIIDSVILVTACARTYVLQSGHPCICCSFLLLGNVKSATAGVAHNKQSPSLIMYLHRKVPADGSTAAHRAAVKEYVSSFIEFACV